MSTTSRYPPIPNTSPVARSTLWYPGYNNVVHATDTFLFAVTQNPTNYQKSLVNVIDITAPDGTMHAYDTITPAGRVEDKFKLDWSDAIFSVISEVSSNPRLTKLETFRLPDPRSLPPFSYVKLGEVELGHGERLFATRFAYPRAYVVTFLQIDPLWIVDLSDPEHPTVSGELEVPGWSTYIHPRGHQLVAVGVETNRTTVSLFDVSDPGAPALLSRVPLGSQYSSSEANRDEKAFTVLEEVGLILIPVQGYTSNGWQSWVQLIDLGANSLAARGRIEHDFAPRYEPLKERRKELDRLTDQARRADQVWLATDLDREGESIAWHIVEHAGLADERVRRVTFSVTMNWIKAFRPGLFQQFDGRIDLDKLEIPDFQPGPAEAAEKRELADAVLLSKSGLTRLVDRMERGWMTSSSDGIDPAKPSASDPERAPTFRIVLENANYLDPQRLGQQAGDGQDANVRVEPTFSLAAIERIAGVAFTNYVEWLRMSFLATLCGLPAISVPCGFTPKGLPVGLQLAGKPFDEPTVLRAAYAYQQHVRLFEKRPPV